jgi:hypothetical protein
MAKHPIKLGKSVHMGMFSSMLVYILGVPLLEILGYHWK